MQTKKAKKYLIGVRTKMVEHNLHTLTQANSLSLHRQTCFELRHMYKDYKHVFYCV